MIPMMAECPMKAAILMRSPMTHRWQERLYESSDSDEKSDDQMARAASWTIVIPSEKSDDSNDEKGGSNESSDSGREVR
jgi:hypothetical protein